MAMREVMPAVEENRYIKSAFIPTYAERPFSPGIRGAKFTSIWAAPFRREKRLGRPKLMGGRMLYAVARPGIRKAAAKERDTKRLRGASPGKPREYARVKFQKKPGTSCNFVRRYGIIPFVCTRGDPLPEGHERR